MKKENFERVRKAFFDRRPFHPFTMELVNGVGIEVNHPEAVRFYGELLKYTSTTEIQCVFAMEDVVRFIDATGTI
jgi:hypothetical protein